jgi:hypothetical protein
MLGNGIKQTSSSSGTGALTVAAVTGSVALTQAFAVGQPISYSIYTGGDSAPVFREAGIGYLSAADTLVRAKVSATFDGTTYNPNNPTATDFGGASIAIICTPHAGTVESMLPTVDKTSSAVARFITSAGRTMNSTTVAPTTLRIFYAPFLLKTGAAVTSLMTNVTTAGAAGTVVRLGVYSCNENGYMGSLLASTGDIDVSSTGQKAGSLTTPVFLPAGWYYVAYVASAAVTVTALTTGVSNVLGGNPLGLNSANAMIDMRYETAASAVLPATASQSTTALPANTHNPAVYLGVQ